MPSKKKKHPARSSDLQREEKLRRAAFFKKVNLIFETVNATELCKTIPSSEWELLYRFRMRGHKVKYAEKISQFPSVVLDTAQALLNHFLESRHFNFPGSELALTYADYFCVLFSLEHWANSLEEEKVPQKAEILAVLKPMIDFNTQANIVESDYERFLGIVGAILSLYPYKVMIHFITTHEIRSRPRPFARFIVELNATRADTKVVKFDGHNRTVYGYISTTKGPLFPTIKAGLIVPNSPIADMEVDIYVQSHVFDRLKERLDCFDPIILKSLMDLCILAPDTCVLNEMRALLSFSVSGHKLGYFVVELVDGVAVIKTFLFLTNDGTPEGKLLQKNLGLSKLDKAYICLDKLSTFVQSDLRNDPLICSILKESDCGQLLHIDPKVMKLVIPKVASIDAEHIRKYLALDEQMAGEDS